MKLIDDWRWVVTKAWSLRLAALAALLSGLEVALAVITAYEIHTPIPSGMFAALSGLVTVAAFIARFVAQDHNE